MEVDDEIYAMFEWIENHADLGRVDVCVANAGMSTDASLLVGNQLANQLTNLY